MVTTLISSLPQPVNAWGTPTRFGVSRSSVAVAEAAAGALRSHFDIDELKKVASATVRELSGAPAACFCHCGSAAMVLAVAAALSGCDKRIASVLPHHEEEAIAAIQIEHCVDYGQPVTQTIRLAGAQVHILDGSIEKRTQELETLAKTGTLKAVVFVESLLASHPAVIERGDLSKLARKLGVSFIVDAAAQDWRLGDESFVKDADLTVFSAQKYLAAPTCGLLVGNENSISACELNLQGIGRPMKPTKEALIGLMAAIRDRDWDSLPELRQNNILRAHRFTETLARQTGLNAIVQAGVEYGPFPRIFIDFDAEVTARKIVDAFLHLPVPIVLGTSRLHHGVATIELTHVDPEEELYVLSQFRQTTSERYATFPTT